MPVMSRWGTRPMDGRQVAMDGRLQVQVNVSGRVTTVATDGTIVRHSDGIKED